MKLCRLLLLIAMWTLTSTSCFGAITDNLVAYYKLDEASGNAVDALGANDLTETSGTIAAATGKVGGARDFEATADTEQFERADNATFSMGDVDVTFSGWFNAETLVNFPIVFAKNSAGGTTDEYALFYNTSTNRLTWAVTNSSGAQGTAIWGSALSTGTWYHVVCWHDSVNNLVGIAVDNGTPVTSAWSTGIRDAANAFQVGASTPQTLYWDGLIDEIGIWKRVLTADERTALYNSGNGRTYPFAVGGAWYYHMQQQ